MLFIGHFAEELANPRTNYFILDTTGRGRHGDIDFEVYQWSRSKYNLVNEGDLFIYRRPGGDFYFFGACKIGHITGDDRVTATLEKPYYFWQHLCRGDLERFQWTWKTRGKTWGNFFNQYGMNKITKEDFVGLLRLSEGEAVEPEEYDPQAAAEAAKSIQKEDYSVDDHEAKQKVRSKQQVFSNQVKANYGGRCGVCSICTKAFLVGSHIVPWAARKESRLDPSNGICLCSLHDAAFDNGYLTIDEEYRVVVSKHVESDPVLAALLKPYHRRKMHLPNQRPPAKEYLDYHRNSIFEG